MNQIANDQHGEQPVKPLERKYIAHRRKSDGQEQSLEAHLFEVGEMAAQLASKIGVTDAGRLLGLLHDFGKYSVSFQEYLGSAVGLINPDADEYVDFKAMKGKIDHSSAGAQWIWQLCQGYGIHGKLVGQILALCIASHHSGLIDSLKPDGVNGFKMRMKKADGDTHLSECLQNAPTHFQTSIRSCIDKQFIANISSQLLQLTRTKDGSSLLPSTQAFYLGFFTRMLFSCLIDADRINSADFENPITVASRQDTPVDWGIPIQRSENFFGQLKKERSIDTIRRRISDHCLARSNDDTGIYTLTVPTGGGKTYASLRFAMNHAERHKLQRIIYVIPFTSIIEQNAHAIRQLIELETDSTPWVLEHHSSIEPEKQTWHSKLASENWDAPVILTTMVQFLEVLFSAGTRNVRRMHQLANSVLIFDEIQTLPINCTHLFCNAINYLTAHTKTTAVMCTATQPVLDRLKSPDRGQLKTSEGNELAPDFERLFEELERVTLINKVKPSGWSVEEIVELAKSELEMHRSCLVIVNTKDWAQKLYQAISAEGKNSQVFHLSTNLCPRHRKAILARIKRRLHQKKPLICISTQLIEAGVDIDFASVIRFLAGLDSVAQAAGRCNRNGELKDSDGNPVKGNVYVLNPDDENIDILQDIKIGRDCAQRVLNENFTNMLAPEAIRQYFNYYFFSRADDMSYTVPSKILGRDDTLLNLLAGNSLTSGSNDPTEKHMLKQSFMTAGTIFKAIDSPTQSVIVPYGPKGKALIADLCGVAKEFDIGRYRTMLRQAQQFSVNVFPNVWEKLVNHGAVIEIQPDEGIYFLGEEFYSPEFGLSTEPCNLMSTYHC